MKIYTFEFNDRVYEYWYDWDMGKWYCENTENGYSIKTMTKQFLFKLIREGWLDGERYVY